VTESSPGRNKFEWQSIVQAAQVETNPEQLKQKIGEAEAALFHRLQALQQNPEAVEERNALQDASNTLLALKRDVLKYPDWRTA
jgi:hypothetical protein